MRLDGKVILVTGSTTGIGRAIAERCAEEGASVMVHGRNRERAREVVAELGETSHAVTAELADPAACERVVEATLERFGRLDGLVNNAALTTRSDLETTDAAMFDMIVAVNLRAPLLLFRAALPQFRRQGGGVVLNIGSINGYCGEPKLLAYSISKGGLITMTRNLADAFGREHIRVNQLNVGWTLSENEIALKIREGMPEDWFEHVPPVYAPSGRLLLPDEVAAHAVHWLSDASAPVSGTVLELEQYPVIGRNAAKEV